MRLTRLALLAAALWAAAATSARAGFVFEFAAIDGTPQTSFTVFGGGSIDVQVYLVDSQNDLLAGNLGLIQVGLGLTIDQPGLLDVSLLEANPAFLGGALWQGFDAASPDQGRLDLWALPEEPFVTGGADGRVLLGAFRLTGTNLGTGLLTASDPDPAMDDTVAIALGPPPNFDLFYVLDRATADGGIGPIAAGGADISVVRDTSVVPEPSSLVLLAGLLGLAAVFAWRRVGALGRG